MCLDLMCGRVEWAGKQVCVVEECEGVEEETEVTREAARGVCAREEGCPGIVTREETCEWLAPCASVTGRLLGKGAGRTTEGA